MASLHLLSLPTEILVAVTDSLNAEDYGHLRVCCRHLEDTLFQYFAKTFFTSKHFFRNYSSLSVLRDISESRLSYYLKTVVLGTELLPSDLYRWATLASVDECLNIYADQRALCASGWDRDLLFLSFCKLPNLEAVVVKEFEGDEHPRLSQTPLKAGYGLKTIMGELGIDNISAFRQDEFDEDDVGMCCVQAVLTSAAKAKKSLKSFKVMYNEMGLGSLACDALHIPLFQRNEIPPVLAGLEELHLDVMQKRLAPWPPILGAGQSHGTVECDTFPLRKFLSYSSQLRRLRLQRLNHHEPKDGFWDWMAAKPSPGYKGPGETARLMTPPPVAFSHLQEFSLGYMKVPIKPFTDLIHKISAKLTKLSLHGVILYTGSLNPNDSSIPSNLWAELLNVLATACGVLYEIDIKLGFRQQHGDRSSNVLWRDNTPPFMTNTLIHRWEYHYKGNDIKGVLEEVMTRLAGQDELILAPVPGFYDSGAAQGSSIVSWGSSANSEDGPGDGSGNESGMSFDTEAFFFWQEKLTYSEKMTPSQSQHSS